MANLQENPYRLIIDSGIDLPPAVEKSNPILIAPFMIQIGELRHRERFDLSKHDFFSQLKKTTPPPLSIFPPSMEEYSRLFREHLAAASRSLLVFTSRSGGTGSFDQASAARNSLNPEQKKRIHLFDTRSISAGSGLLVLKALEMCMEGIPLKRVVRELSRLRKKIRSFGFLIPPHAGSPSNEPAFASFRDGKLKTECLPVPAGLEYEEQTVKRFIQGCKRSRTYHVGIVYSADTKQGTRLEKQLTQTGLKLSYFFHVQASPAFASRIGPHSFAFFALRAD